MSKSVDSQMLMQGLTYGLVEQDGGEEVVEDLTDLRMVRNVVVMGLHQLIFPLGQVGQHLVIKVYVLFHFIATFTLSKISF